LKQSIMMELMVVGSERVRFYYLTYSDTTTSTDTA